MKRRISLAVALGLAVVLAVGASVSSSAPGDNAVVHWSEVAEAAISAPAAPGGPLRPPASSTVLAGMVHAAMYDAVAACGGGPGAIRDRASRPRREHPRMPLSRRRHVTCSP